LWDVTADQLTYKPYLNEGATPFGICVSNNRFSEGTVELELRLKGAEGQPVKSSGRFLFGYRSPIEQYYSVGIMGYGRAYNITRFEPTIGWIPLIAIGNEANLSNDHWYRVKVLIRGQRMTLEVDGVRVLEAVLPAPLPKGSSAFSPGEQTTLSSRMSQSAARKKRCLW